MGGLAMSHYIGEAIHCVKCEGGKVTVGEKKRREPRRCLDHGAFSEVLHAKQEGRLGFRAF